MIKQDITGSQNGWGWKASLEISGCTLLQMQTHLERIPRTMSRELTFGYLQAGICHKSRGQPVLVVSYPHSEKVSPDVHREHPVFHFVPTASGPGTGHYWKEPGSTFTPSLQIFIYAGKSPAELSLLQTDQSQLSQPYPTGEMLQSLRHVCDPFPGLSPVCSLLFYWRVQNRPQHFRCAPPVLNEMLLWPPRAPLTCWKCHTQSRAAFSAWTDTFAGSCPTKHSQCPAGWHPGEVGT